MAEVSIGISGGQYQAYAVYDTAADEAVTGIRIVNNSNDPVTFDAKPQPAAADTVTRFQVRVGARSETHLSPLPHPTVIQWNEGAPHQDGFHSVYLQQDLPDGELTFVSVD